MIAPAECIIRVSGEPMDTEIPGHAAKQIVQHRGRPGKPNISDCSNSRIIRRKPFPGYARGFDRQHPEHRKYSGIGWTSGWKRRSNVLVIQRADRNQHAATTHHAATDNRRPWRVRFLWGRIQCMNEGTIDVIGLERGPRRPAQFRPGQDRLSPARPNSSETGRFKLAAVCWGAPYGPVSLFTVPQSASDSGRRSPLRLASLVSASMTARHASRRKQDSIQSTPFGR